jgi:serine/threonine protein kinase
VHGRVWLCEDTETGDFYAIKCVNRENRKTIKSLKRSQAEAEAARRRVYGLPEHDEEELGGSPKGSREELRSSRAPSHGRKSATSLDRQGQNRGGPGKSSEHLERHEDGGDRSFDAQNGLDHDHDANDDSLASLQRRLSEQRKKRPIVMDEKVKQEIAIMKRCHHEHVVQLREVIDDRRSKKIFMGERRSQLPRIEMIFALTAHAFASPRIHARRAGRMDKERRATHDC